MNLTLESLQAASKTSDYSLDREICDFVETYIGEQGGAKQQQLWQELPHKHRMYYATVILESQVENGGFYQYLNWAYETPEIIQEALDGLRMIGATEHLALTNEALALFVHFIEELEPIVSNPSNGIQRLPKQEESDIDDRYYDLPEMREKRADFARNHLSEFAAEGKEDALVALYERAEELYKLQDYNAAAAHFEEGFQQVAPGGERQDESRMKLFASKLVRIYEQLNAPEKAKAFAKFLN